MNLVTPYKAAKNELTRLTKKYHFAAWCNFSFELRGGATFKQKI
jgi:hypothetical protein